MYCENISPAATIRIDVNGPNDANIIDPNAQPACDINFGREYYYNALADVNGFGAYVG